MIGFNSRCYSLYFIKGATDSSVDADRKAILNRMVGMDVSSGSDPPTEHEKYNLLNTVALEQWFQGMLRFGFVLVCCDFHAPVHLLEKQSLSLFQHSTSCS